MKGKQLLVGILGYSSMVWSGILAAEGENKDVADIQAQVLDQAVQKPTSRNQHPRAQWFGDAGLGLFIHWGIAPVTAIGDLSWCMLANRPWFDGTVKPVDYYASIKDWNPDRLDFDSILKKAKEAGFTYAVFTTKHHDGFAMWPSAYGDMGVKQHFPGKDFVKEYVEACRKHGLKVGLYFSPPDWYFEREYRSWGKGTKGETLNMKHEVAKIPPRPEGFKEKELAMVQGQLRELLTNYGEIDLIWFDGGRGQLPNDEVRRLQPGIVVNRRNGGNGDYGDSEGKLPKGRFKGWFEACVPVWPMRKWSYMPDYPQGSAALTLSMHSSLRAWGGNLLANLGPKANGEMVPEVDQEWKLMAEWHRHSGESVRDTYPGPWPEKINVPTTLKDKVAYLHFLPQLPEKVIGYPAGETHFLKYTDIMPNYAWVEEAVWKETQKPREAILLHSGEKIPFTYEAGELRLKLPKASRSGLVDVVKLVY